MSISISIDIPKSNYFGGERVEGSLVVEAIGDVQIPGIVVNAESCTKILRQKDDEEVSPTEKSRIAEPYRQQLRVAMPKNGEKYISLEDGTTNHYPFAFIFPPDLFPSYYCASSHPESDTCFIASLTYSLTGDVAQHCDLPVDSTPAHIQIVPAALPYGPQPRKGYVIRVFDELEDDELGEHNAAESSENVEPSKPQNGNLKKEKASAGCMGGSGSSKKAQDNNTASKHEAIDSKSQRPARKGGVDAGVVKVALTMQTAYVCLPPNDENTKMEKLADGSNTLWVEVKVSNHMHTKSLPFQMRLSLKMVATYKFGNGEEPVRNVFTLVSRSVNAVLPGGDGQVLSLKPGESTPMRLSMTVPQQLALSPCEAIPIMKQDRTSEARKRTTAPVPPTVETTTFDVRTILQVDLLPLENMTRNGEHVIVLEDPVEIVGMPVGE